MKATILKTLIFNHTTWTSTSMIHGSESEIMDWYQWLANQHAGNGKVRLFTKHKPGHTIDYEFDGPDFHEEWVLLF